MTSATNPRGVKNGDLTVDLSFCGRLDEHPAHTQPARRGADRTDDRSDVVQSLFGENAYCDGKLWPKWAGAMNVEEKQLIDSLLDTGKVRLYIFTGHNHTVEADA